MPYPVPLLDTSIPRENVITEVVARRADLTESTPHISQQSNLPSPSSYDQQPVSLAAGHNITIPEFVNLPLEFSRREEFSTKATDLGASLQGKTSLETEMETSYTNLPEFSSSSPRSPEVITPEVGRLAPVLAQVSDRLLQPTPPENNQPLSPSFQPSIPNQNPDPTPRQLPSQVPNQTLPPAIPVPENTPSPVPSPVPGPVIELNADRQEFSLPRQVVTAEGNAVLRYQQAVMNADRLQVNIPNRFVNATGHVVLRRGSQVLRGDRFQYFLVQNQGTVANASGELFLPATTGDFLVDSNPVEGLPRLPSAEVADRQPLERISSAGGYSFVIGGGINFGSLPAPRAGGTINRLRFQAESLNFDSTGWTGENVRLTNDPFSPPELELRADRVRVNQTQPLVTEITAERARLVLDQSTEIPLLLDRLVLDRRNRSPSILDFGFDSGDRGGLYVQRTFSVIDRPGFSFSLTPQYFIQKATIGGGGLFNPASFGLIGNLDAVLSPTTVATGRAVLTSLDLNQVETRLRASLRVQQTIGTTLPHFLNLEYTYRDRLFNGSLGFQTVHSSIGAVLVSPAILLGDTGVTLTYQGSIQYINADTNRVRLLAPIRANNRVNLTRYQASAALSRSFLLWEGERLPATPDQGLRYSPSPLRPFLRLNTSLSGVYSGYSSGDNQESLTGRIELEGQIGNFSRPYLDYTAFNIGYSQTIRQGRSPFLFDRLVDTRVLSAGIIQQIYGPVRIGFQTAINLDTGRQISTDYLIEYRRRTYSVTLRYNPVLQVGSINLRISDFNWNGNPSPFDDDSGIRPVVQGVTRE